MRHDLGEFILGTGRPQLLESSLRYPYFRVKFLSRLIPVGNISQVCIYLEMRLGGMLLKVGIVGCLLLRPWIPAILCDARSVLGGDRP